MTDNKNKVMEPIKKTTLALYAIVLGIALVFLIDTFIAPSIVETRSVVITEKWMDYGNGERKLEEFDLFDKIFGCFNSKPCFFFKDETGKTYKMAKYEWRGFSLYAPIYYSAGDMFFGIEPGKKYEIEMRGIGMTYHSVNVANIKEVNT